MNNCIESFKNYVKHTDIISVGGCEYQYNTTDSEGWTYWKQLGKGNDLGLRLVSMEWHDHDQWNEGVEFKFHTGYKLYLVRAKEHHPLLDTGV